MKRINKLALQESIAVLQEARDAGQTINEKLLEVLDERERQHRELERQRPELERQRHERERQRRERSVSDP